MVQIDIWVSIIPFGHPLDTEKQIKLLTFKLLQKLWMEMLR